MLSLVEFFEPKITDNQNDDFLRILSKNDLLRKSYLADLQKTYEVFQRTYEKSYEKLTKFRKLGHSLLDMGHVQPWVV